MKKLLSIIAAVLISLFAGCIQETKLPTVAAMTTYSTTIGATAATVVNLTKLDANSCATIKDIMSKIEMSVPATNQAISEVWTKTADVVTKELVGQKKLTEAQAVLIVGAFTVVSKGIDYIFEVKYPEAKQYKDLIDAATKGFCQGFLQTLAVPNKVAAGLVTIDEEARKYILSKIPPTK